ncbi:hypothetical protein CHS0354_005544 [Potamilus streckersoni]|uniref:Folate receptor-like domain-containing protein n=1 Tax=Potamilus streckersoni TaxID=2493646 RepID=A0AAE0RNQ8_9BIVA|nr:hypothetical protein CHS0354_005544 [Potamilus streckersoni]
MRTVFYIIVTPNMTDRLLEFVVFLLWILTSTIAENVVTFEHTDDRKLCTYFENTRHVEMEPGLVNCSWYTNAACCKRTEVTSVFSSNMMALYLATQDCQNRVNYMMCYFCSPDQYRWFKERKVHICSSFCDSTHAACKDAFYRGVRLGDIYKNGTAFCQAQTFEVVSSINCFKYDPTVFGSAHHLVIGHILLIPFIIEAVCAILH